MYRQVNSPKEMMRRVFFFFYVAFIVVFTLDVVAAMARPNLTYLSLALGAFCCAAVFRQIGHRCMDFGRLFESFPGGCARDAVPEPVREEVESLVCEFHASGTDWVRRGEIRHRLLDLEERQPEIIEAYSDDLRDVLAA